MALTLPRIFLLSTHLQPSELHKLEESIGEALTYDVNEAEVILGNISRRERAMFELRRLRLETEPVIYDSSEEQESKRRKVSKEGNVAVEHGHRRNSPPLHHNDATIKFLKLSWLKDSTRSSELLPQEDYLLYEGRRVTPTIESKPKSGADILERAATDTSHPTSFSRPYGIAHRGEIRQRGASHSHSHSQPPALTHRTTSEHDIDLPPIPGFLATTYSCQRPTPVDSPNAPFAEALKGIRTIRLLHGDQVGVRAYSTSIATVAAYPYPLKNAQEVARLPGCGTKIAELWHQWTDAGQLREAAKAGCDPMTSVLQLFYDIWGVGDTTAREFYRKGWRDLDDLVEDGWESLSRVQQIGVKYYDDFKLKIPRKEVESIGGLILDHVRYIDPGFQVVIVGGYRRGKDACGDVDVIISHPDEAMTMHLIAKVVMVLEKAQLITHTLSLTTRNSERGQAPLPWKGEDRKKRGGFDTLDKALIVWQDPTTKNAPHRRVDIIVSPWKTVGCAVLGWSGGTTFQRDLRRYCNKEKGLKFDSSGIRSRTDGMWVDIEGSQREDDVDAAQDMESAEKSVFEGLGLEYRRPEERCTG